MALQISRMLIRYMTRNRFFSIVLVMVLLAGCGNAQPTETVKPESKPSQAVPDAAATMIPTEALPTLPSPTNTPQPEPTVAQPAGQLITVESITDLQTIAALGHGIPYSIALNNDHTTLAAGGPAGVWLYDYPTLEPVRRLASETPGINAIDLAWSPAADLLAAAGAGGSLSVYRTDTWDEVASWTNLPLGLNAVEWSPDGDLLAWGGWGGVVLVMGVSRVE